MVLGQSGMHLHPCSMSALFRRDFTKKWLPLNTLRISHGQPSFLASSKDAKESEDVWACSDFLRSPLKLHLCRGDCE